MVFDVIHPLDHEHRKIPFVPLQPPLNILLRDFRVLRAFRLNDASHHPDLGTLGSLIGFYEPNRHSEFHSSCSLVTVIREPPAPILENPIL